VSAVRGEKVGSATKVASLQEGRTLLRASLLQFRYSFVTPYCQQCASCPRFRSIQPEVIARRPLACYSLLRM
jgi:hypothetical protein